MRLRSHARTSASPAQVWEVLGHPLRWPEFDPLLRRVRGTHGQATAGQTLVGISRVALVGIPIDVLEVVPASRLVLRITTVPGVRETVTYEVLPMVRGGSDVRVSVLVEGLFTPVVVWPLWLASGVRTRLLAARAERIARAARRAA